MKTITHLILLFLFILILILNFRDWNSYKILKIKNSTTIYLDTNKNGQIDEDEEFTLSGIKPFTPEDKVANLNGTDYSFYLNFIGQKWLEENMTNSSVTLSKTNDGKVIVKTNSQNLSNILLEKGIATSVGINEKVLNTKAVKKNIDEAVEKQYVIYNEKSKKYHKLDCKYGQSSSIIKIISKNNLPKSAAQCSFCHKRIKNNSTHYNNLFINHFLPYKTSSGITVYFLDFSNLKEPNNSCDTFVCKSLLNEINTSKSSIDFAIYGINKQPQIYNALLAAQKRGVKLRWVTDYDKNSQNYYPDTILLMKQLLNVNSDKDINPRKKYNAIMHNKFFIFDNKKVWTGSANITDTDFSLFNANYVILINSSEISNLFKQEFEELYNGNFHSRNKYVSHKEKLFETRNIEVFFSPQDNIITSKIIPLIDSAKKYIYIPIFFLTHKGLAEHLILANQRGIDVKVIIDATNAHGKYSVHKYLRQNKIAVKTENKAGKMHMKSIIIDDKYSVLGSMNFTKSGELYNDENVVIIKDENIAKYLKETFLFMWDHIPDKYLNRDPRPEAPESIGSCSDGIDNDFDGKIDTLDDGCRYFNPNYKKPKSD